MPGTISIAVIIGRIGLGVDALTPSKPLNFEFHDNFRNGAISSQDGFHTIFRIAEDVWGATVNHGLIEYSDRRFTIPYGPGQRRQVLDLAEAVRRDRVAADVARDHRDAWKCGRCGYSRACGQALQGR